MKTRTLLFPIVVVAALTQFGCGFALLDTTKPLKTPPLEVDPASVPAIVGDGAQAEIIWASDDSDETVAVSVSTDGTDWVQVGEVPVNDQRYIFRAEDVLTPDGHYLIRITTPSQSIDLGTVKIDRTPPVAGADQVVITCSSTGPITLNASVDALSPIIYRVITGPSLGTITGCLDGTDSRACTYSGSNEGDSDTITYEAVDAAGNRSTPITLTRNHLVCL